jgi:glycosyltransferase involved in cell wall biosynthesis
MIDGGSTDGTRSIARRYRARIVDQKVKAMDFAAWHNQGRDEVKNRWLFYLDADERFTPALAEEIRSSIADGKYCAYRVPRRNFLLGKEMKHGGWYPDYQPRLFDKKYLLGWSGKLHETPKVKGRFGKLNEPMIHVQPATLEPMIRKTIGWTKMEAALLDRSGHPPVVWWRIIRMGLTTLFDRLVKKQGWRDGTEGWIESLFQMFHTMFVYIRLWEIQCQRSRKRE